MLIINLFSELWSWWWDASNDIEKLVRTILSVSVATIWIFWYCWFNAKKPKKGRAILPPGPRGLPLVGYLPFLGTDLHKEYAQLAKVYGPIYKLRLGSKLCMVVSSPSLAKEVLHDQDTTFANRDPSVVSRLVSYDENEIAFASYGPHWKKLRKIFVHEMLSKSSLEASCTLRKQEVRKKIWDVYCNKVGKPVDVGELAFTTNLNAITTLLWGGTLDQEEGAEFRSLVAELMLLLGKQNVSDLFPALAWFDLQGLEKQAKTMMKGFEKFLNAGIEKCTNSVKAGNNEKRKGFMQILLELKDNADPARSLTMTEVKGLFMDVVTGGTHTTATMVEWTMAELMKHEEKMKMVQQELDEVVGVNDCVEEFHLPKLHYLVAAVKETFRLHPALPLLVPRRPNIPCSLGGYTIPEGTTVFLNSYAIQRDPQLWDKPLEFQPARFRKEGIGKFDFSGNNVMFLPFGSGRRICVGQPLAEKMLLYQLASLLHSFDWKLPCDTDLDMTDEFGIVVRKMKPLVAVPTPRFLDPDLYK